jgi:hypothetical protein
MRGQLMVGSLEPLTVHEATFLAKLEDPATRDAFASVGLDSHTALLGWYTAGAKAMRDFVGDGPRLTDDLPLVEYHRSLPADAVPLDLTTLTGDVSEIEGSR